LSFFVLKPQKIHFKAIKILNGKRIKVEAD